MARVVSVIIRVLLAPVVLCCVAASCYYAYEFGLIRGGTADAGVKLGLAAAALDLLKTGLPLLSSYTGNRGQKLGAWVGFGVLTCLSLWCAYGMNAAQIAERMSNKEAASAVKGEAEAVLARAVAKRQAVPQFVPTTAAVVDAANKALASAQEQRTAECEKRGSRCRDREADERNALAAFTDAQRNKALTDQAAGLDDAVKAAETALAHVDVKTAVKEADPQSESMAKVLGVSVDTIQLMGCILFALGIEVGSGLGFWLVFHSTPTRHRIAPQIADSHANHAPQPVAVAPIALSPLAPTSEQHRARFLNECLVPAPDHRIPAASLYVAYARWCDDAGIQPMNSHAFGRDIPWEKKRIAGNVFYIGARIIEAYAAAPSLRIVAAN